MLGAERDGERGDCEVGRVGENDGYIHLSPFRISSCDIQCLRQERQGKAAQRVEGLKDETEIGGNNRERVK